MTRPLNVLKRAYRPPPEAAHFSAGSPDRALAPEQVFPVPLQPIARYRRAALEILGEWLPREKMHAIPRNMHPQGSRAIGRLDAETTGLLLITDDGALLHRVISPRHRIAKRYLVTLDRPLEGHEAGIFAPAP